MNEIKKEQIKSNISQANYKTNNKNTSQNLSIYISNIITKRTIYWMVYVYCNVNIIFRIIRLVEEWSNGKGENIFSEVDQQKNSSLIIR